jgi:hypothetical protein
MPLASLVHVADGLNVTLLLAARMLKTLINLMGTSRLKIIMIECPFDRLCGLVVRVLDYRYRGPVFDSRALQKKSNGSGTGSTQPREYN